MGALVDFRRKNRSLTLFFPSSFELYPSDLTHVMRACSSPGYGQPLATGETATVHFDCRFRGIDAVSSRQAQLLGGNRTIAQPAVVTVGEVPKKGKTDKGRRDELIERSGGLYTGSKGPVRILATNSDIHSQPFCYSMLIT